MAHSAAILARIAKLQAITQANGCSPFEVATAQTKLAALADAPQTSSSHHPAYGLIAHHPRWALYLQGSNPRFG